MYLRNATSLPAQALLKKAYGDADTGIVTKVSLSFTDSKHSAAARIIDLDEGPS
jgi:hypothetical protein